MITVIDVTSKTSAPTPDGQVRHVLGAAETGTRASVAVRDVDPGKTYQAARSDKTQVVYVLEGRDATLTHTSAGKTSEHTTQRRVGVYLEPGEEASVTASGTSLRLLLVTVPKHTGRATGVESPVGYFFQESQLRSLVDERQIRERTFWVNKETGLSSGWDLQIGRMQYAPRASSPRHMHLPAEVSMSHEDSGL